VKKNEIALEKKVKEKKALIGIIGMGYVGLPLAVSFAGEGFKVLGLEQNPKRRKSINQGRSYINDVKDAELGLLVKSGKLKAIDDYQALRKADAICICVPTPLDKNKQPNISFVKSVTSQLSRIIRRGQLIILESTTYPGTTEEEVLPRLEKSGLKAGRDFFLAFSPERVDPGNKIYTMKFVPKVVGGINKASTRFAALLYRKIVIKVHEVSSPRVAEMEKLLENVFRSVNIALVNEMAILCKKMEIDIWEVIEAAKTKPYGFMPFYPGPGIGGHCIPLDPFYLAWKAKEYGINTKFIELAGEVNEKMPEYVVELVQDALNRNGKPLKNAKIAVLGVAYKKNISDCRESPALRIMELLKKKNALVDFNDPYVPEVRINGLRLRSRGLSNLRKMDCAIIAADHSDYDFKKISGDFPLIVDTRNALGQAAKGSRVVKL
jgi:UDP-N-acetyl-D-glucosamine dehydrogenase